MKNDVISQHNYFVKNIVSFIVIMIFCICSVIDILYLSPLRTNSYFFTVNLTVTLILILISSMLLVKKIPVFAKALIPPVCMAAIDIGLAITYRLDHFYLTLLITSVVCFSYIIFKVYLIYFAFIETTCLFVTVWMNFKYDPSNTYFSMLQFLTFSLINVILCISSYLIQKNYDNAKRQSNIFDKMLKTSSSYIVITDSDGNAAYINKKLSDKFSINEKWFPAGVPIVDIIPISEASEIFEAIIETKGHFETNAEINFSGTQSWFQISADLLEGPESFARIIEANNITDIMEAKTKAELMSRSKSDFLANTSHEIRTPMNAIIGMSDLLLTSELTSDQLDKTNIIRRSATNLLKIINDILDFSKINAEKTEIINCEFDTVSLLNDVINIIIMKLVDTEITFTSFISNDLCPVLIGDELRIKQVLTNILNNAVKFTAKGNISLVINSENLPDNVVKLDVYVKDTGIGIKKEDMNKIFNEFEQVDTTRNRNIMGTGLGLIICKRLVELMGGNMGVESEYTSGSTFNFYIFLKRKNDDKLTKINNPEKAAVLVYESDKFELEAMGRILSELNIRHDLVSEKDEYEQMLIKNKYTHSFYCEEPDSRIIPETDCIFIAVKKINDHTHSFHQVIYRPVIITVVADIINNEYRDRVENSEVLYNLDFKIDAKILIVDDNPENLLVSRGLIEHMGAEVTTAENGFEALDLLCENDFDIIFMDHMMPVMDGVETTKRIRELPDKTKNSLPIIALSANAVQGTRELFLNAGMNEFISKPINLEHLKKVLISFLPKQAVLKKDDEKGA